MRMWQFFNVLKILFCGFAIVILVISASDYAQAQNYDLHFDGEALANSITPWMIQNYPRSVSLKDPFVVGIASKLHGGASFRPINDDRRKQLMDWILSQPSRSIYPAELIKQAITISNGETYYGLTLIWDVLREGWGDEKKRNLYEHILKLVDITGELSLFEGNSLTDEEVDRVRKQPRRKKQLATIRGDNFSAWYHFIGTALHSFMVTNSRFETVPGWWKTRFMVWLEENILYDNFIDSKKRIEIDKQGIYFGKQLAENLKKFRTEEEFIRDRRSRNINYLYDNPELYGESWRLRDGQSPHDFGTDQASGRKRGLLTRLERIENLEKQRQTPNISELVDLLMIEDVYSLQSRLYEMLLEFSPEDVIWEIKEKLKKANRITTREIGLIRNYINTIPYENRQSTIFDNFWTETEALSEKGAASAIREINVLLASKRRVNARFRDELDRLKSEESLKTLEGRSKMLSYIGHLPTEERGEIIKKILEATIKEIKKSSSMKGSFLEYKIIIMIAGNELKKLPANVAMPSINVLMGFKPAVYAKLRITAEAIGLLGAVGYLAYITNGLGVLALPPVGGLFVARIFSLSDKNEASKLTTETANEIIKVLQEKSKPQTLGSELSYFDKDMESDKINFCKNLF